MQIAYKEAVVAHSRQYPGTWLQERKETNNNTKIIGESVHIRKPGTS